MRTLSDKSRFDGYSETRSESGNTGTPSPGKLFYKNLIKRADSVSLITVLKHYGYRIDAQNRKLVCPFSKHKNGRESTPSFQYYPETNTFWCFGCKTGRGATDFVANKEGISSVRAAFKILEHYSSEASADGAETDQAFNYSERLEILMEFSNFVREFLQTHSQNPESLTHIERISFSFDRMITLHSVDNDALRRFMLELKSRVN